MYETIIFYFFSFFAIFSTIIMVSTKNNFYNIIFLIFTFVCVVILCFLLNAEYLALIITSVKIVSISILLIFLFMSINPKKKFIHQIILEIYCLLF